MKKKLMLCFSLIAFLLVIGSCHGKLVPKKNGVELIDFEVPESFDETKKHEITFWAKNDTNKVQQEIFNQAVESFEELYPNIHINVVQYNDYTKIYSDVITNISTKTTPNISIAYPDHVATYMEGGDVIVPLDTLMKDERYGFLGSKVKFDSIKEEEILPKFLSECKISDKYCILPFMRSTEALYVNKTYLEENGFSIPKVFTWDYIWEVCSYAKKKSLNDDSTMIPLIYKSTDNMFIQLCKQYDYDYTDSKGKVMFLSDEVSDMLLSLVEPIENGYFDTFKRVSYPGNFFNKGQCIFAIDSTAGSTWIGTKAPLLDIPESELVDFETLVTMIPQVDENNPYMISQGPSMCLFYKEDPQEVLASWLFMQYLLTNPTQIAFSKTEGYLPVTITAVESEEFKAYLEDSNEYDVKRSATKLIMNQLEHTFVTPVFNGSSLCRSAAGYLIEAMFNKKYQDEKGVKELYSIVNTRYKLSTYETK
ncbi:MAG: extracellular solute-binding protein [Roseburia sp.]|nr:extracellular solute-binding protein [Anaeroplasma bactoclasticum]MCM1196307.1 extracellular solute-binding protein [Roseburia sp.]MCM1557171.1 extracellular solute-binding protein [Anaeroplasma bactoclasticum]